MVGMVREQKLHSPKVRSRLKRGRQPHWRVLIPGSAHLGWQRWPDDKTGRWLLRRYVDGKYTVAPLALADDAEAADGERILNFEQADALARATLTRPAVAHGRLTVGMALERYIAHKLAVGANTGDISGRGRAHILPELGNIQVADLTAARLQRWLADIANGPALVRSVPGTRAFKAAPRDDEGVRRRRSSANRIANVLKAALNFCFDEGLVSSNQAWGRRFKPFKAVDAARVRYLTVEEAQRLINACGGDFRLLVIGALQTGARYGELIRLQVHDFNVAAGTLAIRKSKSGKPRHVVLIEEGAAFFAQVVAGRAGHELMFQHADGRPWLKSHQTNLMTKACAHARITPAIGFHGLRHSWASLAVMNGTPLLVVAKNLGHADTKMVEKHYGHLAPSYVTDAIRAGAPRFGFKPDKKLATLRGR
jgi:integrase